MNRVKFDTQTVSDPKPTAATKRRQKHQADQATNSQADVHSTHQNQSKTQENHPEQTSMKSSSKTTNPKKNFIIALVMVVAGIGTGYVIYNLTTDNSAASASISQPATPASADQVVAGEVYGAEQGDVFTDETEGVLVKGGVKGEGSHHIMREGGPARNVYLTSSVLDLNLFVDHQVKVWGETFQAQEAGWLMDVGRVEVVELNAEKPFEVEVE